MIKAVAYNFVTERCPGEVMALGINSIREVARRIPALLEEEGMDVLVLVRRSVVVGVFGDDGCARGGVLGVVDVGGLRCVNM